MRWKCQKYRPHLVLTWCHFTIWDSSDFPFFEHSHILWIGTLLFFQNQTKEYDKVNQFIRHRKAQRQYSGFLWKLGNEQYAWHKIIPIFNYQECPIYAGTVSHTILSIFIYIFWVRNKSQQKLITNRLSLTTFAFHLQIRAQQFVFQHCRELSFSE